MIFRSIAFSSILDHCIRLSCGSFLGWLSWMTRQFVPSSGILFWPYPFLVSGLVQTIARIAPGLPASILAMAHFPSPISIPKLHPPLPPCPVPTRGQPLSGGRNFHSWSVGRALLTGGVTCQGDWDPHTALWGVHTYPLWDQIYKRIFTGARIACFIRLWGTMSNAFLKSTHTSDISPIELRFLYDSVVNHQGVEAPSASLLQGSGRCITCLYRDFVIAPVSNL